MGFWGFFYYEMYIKLWYKRDIVIDINFYLLILVKYRVIKKFWFKLKYYLMVLVFGFNIKGLLDFLDEV